MKNYKIISIIFLIFILGVGLFFFIKSKNNYYSGPESDHFDGRQFFNPGKPNHGSFLKFLKWKFKEDKKPWPDFVPNEFEDRPPAKVEGDDLRVSFVGHVTFLLQTEGINILTDPVWSERVSPVNWYGPKRVHAPGIRIENLPKINIVLISHNHYDHLDLETIQKIWERDKPLIITPLGNDRIIRNFDSRIQVNAYDWHQNIQVKEDVEIALSPMHHWSARGIFDRNKALWAAFVIKTPGGNIYFVGDSGYGKGDYFRKDFDRYGPFRLALLPMGACEPRWFMEYSHMNPEEVVLAYKDLGSPFAIPSHYNIFPLGNDGYDEALQRFLVACQKENISLQHFNPLKVGEVWWVPRK